MTMELITFDPSTGKTIDPNNLNEMDRILMRNYTERRSTMKYYYNHFLFGHYIYKESDNFHDLYQSAIADAIDCIDYDTLKKCGQAEFPIYRNIDDVVCIIKVRRGLYTKYFVGVETENSFCLVRIGENTWI